MSFPIVGVASARPARRRLARRGRAGRPLQRPGSSAKWQSGRSAGWFRGSDSSPAEPARPSRSAPSRRDGALAPGPVLPRGVAPVHSRRRCALCGLPRHDPPANRRFRSLAPRSAGTSRRLLGPASLLPAAGSRRTPSPGSRFLGERESVLPAVVLRRAGRSPAGPSGEGALCGDRAGVERDSSSTPFVGALRTPAANAVDPAVSHRRTAPPAVNIPAAECGRARMAATRFRRDASGDGDSDCDSRSRVRLSGSPFPETRREAARSAGRFPGHRRSRERQGAEGRASAAGAGTDGAHRSGPPHRPPPPVVRSRLS